MKVWRACDLADAKWATPRAEDTLPAGFGWLERHVGRLLVGDVVVIAGRRNAGKSHLALAMLAGMARAGTPVMYASLEDGIHRVAKRVRAGYTVDGLSLVWPTPTTSGLVEVVETAAPRGVRVLAVDYLQRVRHDGDAWSKADGVGSTIAALKAAAREHRMALVLLSQAKQPGRDEDPSAPPGDYACRESADIEDMADVVLTIGTVRGRIVVRLTKAKDASTGSTFAMERDDHTGVLREPTTEGGGDGRRRHEADDDADDDW